MIYKTINLSEKYPEATLTTYVSDDTPEMKMPPRQAIVVCPGGGYGFLSDREGECIVKFYLAAGLNAFLLRYGINENAKNCAPLIQAGLAIKHVREHAEEYNIDPDQIFITGFSAGGHLAASAGTIWNYPEVVEAMGDAPYGINRPTGTILAYPVIHGFEYAHKGTINRVCGSENPSDELRTKFSIEKHVTAETAPSFIWHTFDDAAVPVENSLLYASALRKAGINFELHIYPAGPHGLSLANEETWVGRPDLLRPEVSTWAQMSVTWIKGFKNKA